MFRRPRKPLLAFSFNLRILLANPRCREGTPYEGSFMVITMKIIFVVLNRNMWLAWRQCRTY